ncbi:MAG: amidase family protein, partial [Proteobacteria bacterium]|nr:amidase family protein [Pseudomonadota bacterium]
MSDFEPLYYRSAAALATSIKRRELGVTELMDASLARIETVNGQVNAIVSLDAEAARETAKTFDEQRKDIDDKPLYGLPIAIKDLVLTKGIRTTFGSPIYRDFVPDIDELIVKRLKEAGAIVIGKTNVPEFGAGSQTFNRVFGTTLNPYDPGKTCGGSSGGAAVALAARMLPLADGSDL